MTFSFTNYAGIEPQKSPMHDMIGKLLSGYTGATSAKYLPKTLEADIFHKQISPLAMLASSPFFSSLHPEQQQQIAGYISQMLTKQAMGQPMGAGQGGMPNAQSMPQTGQPNQTGANSNIDNGQSDESLVPGNTAGHFVNKFTESPYGSGVPHRGASGETVYTPTGAAVEQGTKVLRETKGLKPIFDEFSQAATRIAKGGPIKEAGSVIGSNINKLTSGLPGGIGSIGQGISSLLGGSKLADARSKMESTKAKMIPALAALGYSPQQIESMFSIYPGETEKNIKDRMSKTWPVIERKIKEHAKNLRSGTSVNNPSEMPQEVNPVEYDSGKVTKEHIAEAMKAKNKKGGFKEAPPGTVGLYNEEDGELYYIPKDKVEKAIATGKYNRD